IDHHASTPTGMVTFLDGATALGTAAVNASSQQATLTTSTLSTGAHSITARYDGTTNLTESTSPALMQTIDKAATTTTVTSSLNQTLAGQPVVLTATVNVVPPASGTPAGAVTFVDGTTTLATVTLNASRQVTMTTSALSVGTHSIAARYAGSTNFAAS